MASNNIFVTFHNGEKYPILGFGTWKVIITVHNTNLNFLNMTLFNQFIFVTYSK